jgi:hypothetical protein
MTQILEYGFPSSQQGAPLELLEVYLPGILLVNRCSNRLVSSRMSG